MARAQQTTASTTWSARSSVHNCRYDYSNPMGPCAVEGPCAGVPAYAAV